MPCACRERSTPAPETLFSAQQVARPQWAFPVRAQPPTAGHQRTSLPALPRHRGMTSCHDIMTRHLRPPLHLQPGMQQCCAARSPTWSAWWSVSTAGEQLRAGCLRGSACTAGKPRICPGANCAGAAGGACCTSQPLPGPRGADLPLRDVMLLPLLVQQYRQHRWQYPLPTGTTATTHWTWARRCG